ncbi:protein of unknown function DUF29 [Nitrosococcus halophilus Nc 4]|uniref:DUF29 domain-containing protein n=1 Tax=Nitrosococcus halophilus (strain Nc4) TaxID=472759 RepID=D5C341_NITHN|nr:DUF29 domain-containing protein [Nitrosococcus halophilus]ADE14933.1 protein of unknown function DUF29 [Nitrosococcus halophilus Nc 4]
MTDPTQDYYAWTQETIEKLRQGKLSEVDVNDLIEELEDMGASERRATESRLEVLLAHLLKWQYQPERRGKSWRLTIEEQRLRVQDRLEESPSLGPVIHEKLPKIYRRAVLMAARETNKEKNDFPAQCPWSMDEMLDDCFWPG